MTCTPVWFGPEDRSLLGWVHTPDRGSALGAVIVCPPLGRELNSAHFALRQFANHLCRAGMLAVRFDYDGTGDSVGEDKDPDRVRSWIESIGEAVALARSCGASSVSLVGMRMGAWLAAAAAPHIEGLDGVVLWDPCQSGRAFVREMSAMLRLMSDGPVDQVEGTQMLGFVFSDQTVADLTSLAVTPTGQVPRRVLLLSRPDKTPVRSLAETLGAALSLDLANGQEEFLEVDPVYRCVPVETIRRIVAWLLKDAVGAFVPVAPPSVTSTCFRRDDVALCERIVRLGPLGMFGVETAPDFTGMTSFEPESANSTPTVLFLNAGNDAHIGPSRLWVDLSRRWATLGLRCVRFDLTGIGESPTRPGKPDNVVRSPDAFEDMAQVRQSVEPDDPSKVILVGLCSGGYQALEDALANPVRAVYAINPVLHFSPPELDYGPMDPRRRICWPTQGLSRAYRSLLMEPVRRRLRHVAWHFAHFFNRHRDRNPIRWLGELRRHGVRVFVVCGEDQAYAFGWTGENRRIPKGPDDPIRIDVIAGLDGALLSAGQRREVTDQLTAHVAEHFGISRHPSAAHAPMV